MTSSEAYYKASRYLFDGKESRSRLFIPSIHGSGLPNRNAFLIFTLRMSCAGLTKFEFNLEDRMYVLSIPKPSIHAFSMRYFFYNIQTP